MKISNAGVQRTLSSTDGSVVEHGEQYAVSCPFCGDTRGRLYISHAYDAVHRPHLAYCHNEEKCLADRKNRRALAMMLTAPLSERARAPVISIATRDIGPVQPPEFPSATIPLTQLPSNHPAITYLLNRGFDPSLIEQFWGVTYCECATNCQPSVYRRLIIPLWSVPSSGSEPPAYAGWQARTIADGIQSKYKYLFPAGLRKSELVYGLDYATRRQPDLPIVVCEGVTSVWRMGPGAVATFGKTISPQQVRQLVEHGVGWPIVVFGDAGAQREAQTTAQTLRTTRQQMGLPDPVFVAALPAGRTDPAECTFEEAWAAVYHSQEVRHA